MINYIKSSQNSCLLYYKMKTVKSYGKVTKPSFFDRVRNYSQKDFDQKQKFDINHIRQSNYKLERSKSHRTEHSLQRKAPIIAPQLKMSKSKQNLQKRTLQTEFSEDFKDNTYKVKYDDCFKQNKENECQTNGEYTTINNQNQIFFEKKKKCGKEMNFNQVLSLLKTSLSKKEDTYKRQSVKQPNLSLQQEEECLNLIKLVWQGINLMKCKQLLRQQALKMQQLLKLQVIKLAKPKLQVLQQSSINSLNIFPFGATPLGALKEQNDKSVRNFNIRSQQYQQDSEYTQKNNNSQFQSKEQLEYKKIMYILEQSKKNKLADMIHESMAQITQKQHFSKGLDQSSSIQIKSSKKKYHLSSFNSMGTASDTSLVYQQEKINNSRSNDKLFLKNIVKKAKKVDHSHPQQPNSYFAKKNALDSMNIKEISSVQSEIRQSITQEQQESMDESYEVESDTLAVDSQSGVSSKYSGNSKVMSESEIAKNESESKRITLNNIVNMLNQRYNKQIRLQPPK